MITPQELKNIFYKNDRAIAKRFSENWINNYNSRLFEDIINATSFMDLTYSIGDRIHAIIIGQTSAPTCLKCGSPTKRNRDGIDGFRLYCSPACAKSCPQRAKKISKSKSTRDNTKSNIKRKRTMLEKYGVETNSQRTEVRNILSKKASERQLNDYARSRLSDKNWLETEYHNKERTSVDIARELGINNTTVLEYCRQHGFDIRSYSNYSLYELELREWMNSLDVKYINNDRRKVGVELDIYLPDYNIAIEFNGLWFHSEMYKDRNYHYRKYKTCEKNGIDLLMIFEDEWVYRKQQVKNFILSRMGKFKERVYGRDCMVKNITREEYGSFYDNNHIQGTPNASILSVGLIKDNVLLGCVSFSKHHRQYNDIVLNRLAFKSGVQIIGGASKLVKNAIKLIENDKIITWSDNRWSTGNIYAQIGFSLDEEMKPDYSYINRSKIVRKSKQSMKKSVTGCPKDITEKQWCQENGWYRIWDCGKKRWVYRK